MPKRAVASWRCQRRPPPWSAEAARMARLALPSLPVEGWANESSTGACRNCLMPRILKALRATGKLARTTRRASDQFRNSGAPISYDRRRTSTVAPPLARTLRTQSDWLPKVSGMRILPSFSPGADRDDVGGARTSTYMVHPSGHAEPRAPSHLDRDGIEHLGQRPNDVVHQPRGPDGWQVDGHLPSSFFRFSSCKDDAAAEKVTPRHVAHLAEADNERPPSGSGQSPVTEPPQYEARGHRQVVAGAANPVPKPSTILERGPPPYRRVGHRVTTQPAGRVESVKSG